MPDARAVLSQREVTADRWRHSTYVRGDGSTFHVAIPPLPASDDDEDRYDESVEEVMFRSLL